MGLKQINAKITFIILTCILQFLLTSSVLEEPKHLEDHVEMRKILKTKLHQQVQIQLEQMIVHHICDVILFT